MLRHLHCLVYKHFRVTSEVNCTCASISRSHVASPALNTSPRICITAVAQDPSTCLGSAALLKHCCVGGYFLALGTGSQLSHIT